MKTRKTVLVVEDSPLVNELVSKVLLSADYEVISALTPAESLAAIGQRQIDLLVTDVTLPGLDGVELMYLLKAQCPRMQVLFMSGWLDGSVQARVEATGCAHIAKPFRPSMLVDQVRALLDLPTELLASA